MTECYFLTSNVTLWSHVILTCPHTQRQWEYETLFMFHKHDKESEFITERNAHSVVSAHQSLGNWTEHY